MGHPIKGRSTKQGLTVEARRAEVFKLALQGYSVSEIADKQGVNQRLITGDLIAARRRVINEQGSDIKELVAQEIARLDYISTELWAAWQRSLKPTERQLASTQTNSKGGEWNTTEYETNTQVGDARIMQQIISVGERRAKLLGLDAPIRTEVSVINNMDSYTKLTDSEREVKLLQLMDSARSKLDSEVIEGEVINGEEGKEGDKVEEVRG